MPISTWPSDHPPLAYWELLWIRRDGEYVEGTCRVVGHSPTALAQALVAARVRQGLAADTPEVVMTEGIDVDQPLRDFLAPYVEVRFDPSRYRYQIGLVDESGGKERTDWGQIVD
jgi:hypothetical protein